MIKAPWYNDPVEALAFNMYAMNTIHLEEIAKEIVETYAGDPCFDLYSIKHAYSLSDEDLYYIKDYIERNW